MGKKRHYEIFIHGKYNKAGPSILKWAHVSYFIGIYCPNVSVFSGDYNVLLLPFSRPTSDMAALFLFSFTLGNNT